MKQSKLLKTVAFGAIVGCGVRAAQIIRYRKLQKEMYGEMYDVMEKKAEEQE